MTDTANRAGRSQSETEAARQAKLDSFNILDTAPEQDFDTITWLAQSLLGCPVAFVSLVDRDRQWFKSRQGTDLEGTPRSDAFCAHTIHYEDIMVVEDATGDPRFADNPQVTGPLGVRFYAGVPLRPASLGHGDDLPAIGTLCVVDVQPRSLSDHELGILRDLARVACRLLEARRNVVISQDLLREAGVRAHEIDRKNRQLHQAERMAGIGSWWLDLATQRIEWSEQVYVIHGLPAHSPPPLDDALRFFPEQERAMILRCLKGAIERGEPFDFESDFITADGRVRRVRSMGEPEYVDERPVALIGVFQDITERHTREQELRHSASTDSLTGLPNRAAFERRMETALLSARAQDAPLALLVIDLDGFKEVNDKFGHEAGDEVLRAMAERMRSRKFVHAFAARLGGDEFVMLVTRPRDCARLDDFISSLLAALRHTIERDGTARSVSATIGAARCVSGTGRTEVLLRHADLALYQAKRDCRGTGRVFGQSHVIGCAREGGEDMGPIGPLTLPRMRRA
jgi:diguanylate cyclase (GGDEF)-like protein/PAS domain S-box-containing protein